MVDKTIIAKRIKIDPVVNEITIVTPDGMLVASVSLYENSVILAEGYKVAEYDNLQIVQ